VNTHTIRENTPPQSFRASSVTTLIAGTVKGASWPDAIGIVWQGQASMKDPAPVSVTVFINLEDAEAALTALEAVTAELRERIR